MFIFISWFNARHFEYSCQRCSLNEWNEKAQRLKLQERLLTINKRNMIRWNRDNNFHSRRQVFLKSVSKNSESSSLKLKSLRFKRASRCLLFFPKMNSRQENRSELSFTATIITKCSLERFLSICSEKMSKGFLKFWKLISILILGQII